MGRKGRAYWIGIKFAFLEIREDKCTLRWNMELQQPVQEGSIEERLVSIDNEGRDVSAAATASAKANPTNLQGEGRANVGGGYRNTHKREKKSEFQYERFRVRWEAGGCRFGERRSGDPYHPDGVLQGVFLNGNWGRLVPHRGVSNYGAQITLLLQKGMLSVVPESWRLKDMIPDSLETEAFNTLKSAVASWALESRLPPPRYTKGFDAERGELVLAHGQVAVDLSKLKSISAQSESPKLVAGDAARTLFASRRKDELPNKLGAPRPRKDKSKAPGT